MGRQTLEIKDDSYPGGDSLYSHKKIAGLISRTTSSPIPFDQSFESGEQARLLQ